ncbi:MAG TPA: ATP-binding cassette domain-containing protein [Stellaceae bacterium]|nr:ATP-binding cassette domain-containing protein [Stellaceae bacterium]
MSDAAISLRGVTLMRGDRPVLTDVDAEIAPGEFIGILGPNGSGKTTLLHALLGLIPPASGTLRVFGAPPGRAASAIGYLPQKRSSLSDFAMRGRDFIGSAVRGERWGVPYLSAADRRNIAEVLDLVDGADLAERPLSDMSGGETQRLLLAKALLGKPKLLLLDEPLMSLDLRFQAGVVSLVENVRRRLGLTVLFTAHELNPLLGVMDRVFYLAYGRAALGAVDAVMTSEVLSRLYRTPIDVLRVGGRIVVVSSHGEMDIHAHHDHGHDHGPGHSHA